MDDQNSKDHLDDLFAANEGANIAEKTKDFYIRWAEEYDVDHKHHIIYRGPGLVAEATAEILGSDTGARILDLGAGTGLCGKQLHKRGYQNLDALDACEEMLEIAKGKGVYKKLICDYLGANRLPIPDNTYDALILTGVFSPNHANDECFEEVVRILKPGGHFVFAMNVDHLEAPDFKGRFEPRLQDFVKRGLWKIIRRTRTDHFVQFETNEKPHPGSLTVLQKC